MPTLFYHKSTVIGKLHAYFSSYFQKLTRPTARLLIWIAIAMIAVQGVPSLRWLYEHFLAGFHQRSLEAFYYACKHSGKPICKIPFSPCCNWDCGTFPIVRWQVFS